METSEEEINQTIVINDLLSFVWCKLEMFSKDRILKAIEEFYGKEEASDALRTLLTAIPSQYTKHGKINVESDPYSSILEILKDCPVVPVFVCKDLNNIPKLENILKSEKKTGGFMQGMKREFHKEHELIKSQMNEAFRFLQELQKQFHYIASTRRRTNNDNNNNNNKNSKKGIEKLKKELQPQAKGLSHLQNLIDEAIEEENEEFGYNELEDIDDDEDILDQRSKLLANRHQRASLKTKNNKKIILIGQDKKPFASSLGLSSDHGNEESSGDGGEMDDTASESLNADDFKEKFSRYLTVEHMFEENIGFFTVYKCSLCSLCSNDEETAVEHKCIRKIDPDSSSVKYEKRSHIMKRRKLKDQENKRNVFQCHRCGEVFKTRKELMTHTEKYLEGGYRCPLCENRYSLKEWDSHVRLCSGNGTNLREDHYCEVCDVFFADRRTLCNHKAFHDPCRPFECSECKFRFYTPKNLEDHMQKHTSVRFNKKCPFCDFRSTEQIKIVDHTRCHTGDRPYKCPQCDHYCSTYEGVQRHLTSHTITKDFACDICGKRFNSQNNMASHRKIHKVDKPHRCPICKKAFKFGRLMKLHHRTHLDIREHKCPHCPYKARTAVVLRGHMNTHTNKKPYKCNLCDFGANHKSYLTWHMKYYHPS